MRSWRPVRGQPRRRCSTSSELLMMCKTIIMIGCFGSHRSMGRARHIMESEVMLPGNLKSAFRIKVRGIITV